MTNRSAPPSTVIPVILYPDIHAAALWLKKAFGFRERLRIADHRIQMHAAQGHIVLHQANAQPTATVSVMIRTEEIDEIFQRAVSVGARVRSEPVTHTYGERQCSLVDPFGYCWNFTQTVQDIDPATWGGETVEPDTL